MAQKHLRELLNEDQEPFLLKSYISQRLSHLKTPNYSLQKVKKKHPIHQPSIFPINLCKNACFLSFQTTPESQITKSPIFDLTSPAKSPLRFHVPARTAKLLLEAALRIQNQKHSKPKTRINRTNAFGVFGSFFKKLTQRRKREIEYEDSVAEVRSCEVCSCNGSSAVWSESNEDKSMDLESCSSGHSCDSGEEQIEFVNKSDEKTECGCFDNYGFFCESPFHFVLQRSPSYCSGHRTPEFASPSRHRTQDEEGDVINGIKKLESEEEEEKEQCSPVCVLDAAFEDDDDDLEYYSSYANVQRTKKHLLDKLRRFEKLAELDPLELEKKMLDQEDMECETFIESFEEKALREMILEILYQSNIHDKWQAQDLKRLVYDLIKEDQRDLNSLEDRNLVIKRVCRKLELWKEVESNTIDMMVEEDFSRDENGWKKISEHKRELAEEIELAIFCLLIKEFSEELVC